MLSAPPARAAAPATPATPSRRRTTSRRVLLVDRLTTAIISTGGILVIVAVLAILVFLALVVWPLFRGATVETPRSAPVLAATEASQLVSADIDEYKRRGMALERDGQVAVFDAATGELSERLTLFSGAPEATAFARDAREGQIAVGFADGTVRLGRLAFGPSAVDATLDAPIEAGAASPVVLLDRKTVGDRDVFTTLQADGALSQSEVRSRETPAGDVEVELERHPLPFAPAPEPPAYLLQNRGGDQVYIAWRDGTTRRYDLRRIAEPLVAETFDLVPDRGAELTGLVFMLGDQSLIATDSLGTVNAWFRVPRADAATGDGYQMTVAHRLEPHSSAVALTAISSRDKGLLTATESGEIWLRHMTSEQVLARLTIPGGARVAALQITPKADGIFALDESGRAWLWDLANPHPETTARTIFGRVWYEGYEEPTFTWQSSSGSDEFEPKFSLVPLIYGTLKATLYSLLFAVPIAIAAAIYTSLFLHRDLRQPIKSVVETMASLPSVVLGFVAALVLAPIVEERVVAVLAALVAAPLCALLVGYLWPLVPKHVRLRYQTSLELPLLMASVVGGIAAAAALARSIERWFFAGDFKAWLDGSVGSAAPGIALLVWPLAILLVWLGQSATIGDALDRRLRSVAHDAGALLELLRFVAVLAAAAALAWLIGAVLASMGFDPRHALVGTYVQRNTLVVGFVMGFAVIPIIYTISEDALSSVPEHLRTASLACGATAWQTAVRVILPVAMSGIFSAVMIGLGRAVGETMIVVMAAGNTPVMDVNIFNGLRALSANIVVELPEAVRDSTLYRMLFLAALSLFAVTFLVNTLAEVVRMRFRKRAFEL
jgi:phosphate transport system permease protein